MDLSVSESRQSLDGPKDSFCFSCHSGVDCYLSCCHRVTLYLFPYDVIRLKQHLQMSSRDFLERYVRVVEGSHPYFPSLILAMEEKEGYPCPFLGVSGCSVYADRPSACRTYPLERSVESKGSQGSLLSSYAVVRHPYCQGHLQEKRFTVRQWERDQHLDVYNQMNDLWAQADAFFATNPWRGEGHGGPLQQLAFMVAYNIDDFREYVHEHDLLRQFRLDKRQRRHIREDDGALLRFGLLWLQFSLGGRPTLQSV